MSIFDLFSSDPQKRIEADRELGDLENNIHERTSKISFATIVSVFLFVLLPLFSMLKMGIQDFRTMGFFLVIGGIFAILVSKWLQRIAKPPQKDLDTSNQTVFQNDEETKTFEELQFETKLETMNIPQAPQKSFFSFLDSFFEKLETSEGHVKVRKFALALLRFVGCMVFFWIICEVFRELLVHYVSFFLQHREFLGAYAEMVTDLLIWLVSIALSFFIAKTAFQEAHDEKHFPLDRYPFDISGFLELSCCLFVPMFIFLTEVLPNFLKDSKIEKRGEIFLSNYLYVILGAIFLSCLIAFLRVRPRKRKVNIAKKSSDSQNELSTVKEGK